MSEQRPRRVRLKDASAGTPGERGKARIRASINHAKGVHDRSDRQHPSQESKSTRATTHDLRTPSSVRVRRKVLAFPDLRGNHLQRNPEDVNRSRLPVIFRGPMHASLRW